MGLLEARMAQKRGKIAQLTYALKVSASSKDSFSCSYFSYTLNAITSISVPCVIFLSTTEYVFFYFSSLIQPSLEEDVSTEILLANKKLRSNVWKEFELTMLDDGTYKAICKHCKKDFVAGNRAATSHLKYHTGGLYMRAIQVVIVNQSWRSILKTRLLLELAIVLLILWLGGRLMAQNIQSFLGWLVIY